MFGGLKNKIKTFLKKEEKQIEEKLEPEEETTEEEPIPETKEEPKTTKKEKKKPVPTEKKPVPKTITAKKTELKEAKKKDRKQLEKKVTLGTKLKKTITRKATIKEEDVAPVLEDFELELLEADVSLDVAETITNKLKEKIVGKQVSSKQSITQTLETALSETLLEILPEKEAFKTEKKPTVIMFVGPNGHGKTTTIIKTARYLQKQGKQCVLAAADTFRAASIEQLETLAKELGVKVIKHDYGADPAAVCYDAISHAKARNLDCVLIDTAGRSELNKNLMEELGKIERVAKPDIKVYIGESLAGNAAVEEAKNFNQVVNFDGIIMTKVDCDVKGGSILSVSAAVGKPIYFLGTGQSLDDLTPYDPEWLVEKILGE